MTDLKQYLTVAQFHLASMCLLNVLNTQVFHIPQIHRKWADTVRSPYEFEWILHILQLMAFRLEKTFSHVFSS